MYLFISKNVALGQPKVSHMWAGAQYAMHQENKLVVLCILIAVSNYIKF
jgi:hypothetical protein